MIATIGGPGIMEAGGAHLGGGWRLVDWNIVLPFEQHLIHTLTENKNLNFD
jgi:hypothetical protein